MSRCQDTTGCQCSEAASPGRAGENWIYPGLLEQEGNAVFLSLLLTHTYQKHQNSGTDPRAWESCCCLQYCLTMGTFNLYSQVWRHGLARAIIVDSVRESEYKQYDYLKGQMNWKKNCDHDTRKPLHSSFHGLNILYQLSYNTQRKLIIRHRNRQVFSCTRQTLKKTTKKGLML